MQTDSARLSSISIVFISPPAFFKAKKNLQESGRLEVLVRWFSIA